MNIYYLWEEFRQVHKPANCLGTKVGENISPRKSKHYHFNQVYEINHVITNVQKVGKLLKIQIPQTTKLR